MMARRTLKVSDHALVRWLERTGALDTEAIRAMLHASLEKAAHAGFTLGSTNFVILADGMVYHVRDDTLVSCMPDEGMHTHTRALRPRAPETGQ